MGDKWVALIMDPPRLREIYRQVLRRQGCRVHTACDFAEVKGLFEGGQFDALVVDEDIGAAYLDRVKSPSAEATDPTAVVLLTGNPPQIFPTEGKIKSRLGTDLVLRKPVSPMEFGLQIDSLLSGESSPGLDEFSRVQREFGAMQRDFVFQLDTELNRIEDLWTALEHGADQPQRPAARLRRVVSSLCSMADHLGFETVANELTAIKETARPLMRPDQTYTDAHAASLETSLQDLRHRCLELQQGKHSSLPVSHDNQSAYIFLVIDPDTKGRRELEEFGEQFMVRMRSAATLEEGRRLARTPLLTGVFLAASAVPQGRTLRECIEALRTESPLATLPIAILDEPDQTPDRIRGLWAGASLLLSKPMTAHTFGRALRRLATLCRAQKSTILVVEPQGSFAEFLARQLNPTTTTVHYDHSPDQLFESLEKYRPDLLVIDTHPGELSAFDICRTLRAMPRWQDLPVVMIADEDSHQTRLAAFRAGADDFITRQIDGPEVQARLTVRLQRSRLLKERADYDLLTGLMTRRAFLEQLASRLSESARHGRKLAFCLLDVDRFKQVNDLYGHPAGDRVLEKLGELLRNCFRIEDLRARWGGEEFAVVLVDEGVDTAHLALQRLLDEFSKIEFKNESGRHFKVTFSAGIAEFPNDGDDAESLVSAADDRLLRAKRSGRNTIVVGHR